MTLSIRIKQREDERYQWVITDGETGVPEKEVLISLQKYPDKSKCRLDASYLINRIKCGLRGGTSVRVKQTEDGRYQWAITDGETGAPEKEVLISVQKYPDKSKCCLDASCVINRIKSETVGTWYSEEDLKGD